MPLSTADSAAAGLGAPADPFTPVQGCGIVTMETHAAAAAAIEALADQHRFPGSDTPLVAKWVDQQLQQKRPRRSSEGAQQAQQPGAGVLGQGKANLQPTCIDANALHRHGQLGCALCLSKARAANPSCQASRQQRILGCLSSGCHSEPRRLSACRRARQRRSQGAARPAGAPPAGAAGRAGEAARGVRPRLHPPLHRPHPPGHDAARAGRPGRPARPGASLDWQDVHAQGWLAARQAVNHHLELLPRAHEPRATGRSWGPRRWST